MPSPSSSTRAQQAEQQRRLAAAGAAHDADLGAGRDGNADAVERKHRRLVGCREVGELNGAAGGPGGRRGLPLARLVLGLDVLLEGAQARDGAQGRLEPGPSLDQAEEVLVGL